MKIGEVKRLSHVLLENDYAEEEVKANLEPAQAAIGNRDLSLVDMDDDLLSAD